MGFEKVDRFCRFDQPGCHMLHELATPDFIFHKRITQSGLPNAHRKRRSIQECALCSPAGFLRFAIFGKIGWHEKAYQVVWLGNIGHVYATRRSRTLSSGI